jgi:hypothetical protein
LKVALQLYHIISTWLNSHSLATGMLCIIYNMYTLGTIYKYININIYIHKIPEYHIPPAHRSTDRYCHSALG